MSTLLAIHALLAAGAQVVGLAVEPGVQPASRLAIVSRSWSPVVAIVVAFPAGSGEDPAGEAGLARLAADAVTLAASARSGSGAVFSAQVTREATFFSALAVPEAWDDAYRALAGALFTHDLPAAAIAAARASLLGTLRAEAGAPVREVETEILRTLLGAQHPWARPVSGTPDAVAHLDDQRVRRWAAERFRPERATFAVVGPVDTAAAAAFMRSAAAAPAPPPAAAAPAPVDPGGARTTLYREVTSAWIAAAFPASAETEPVVREFLAHHLDDRINVVPRDPALFEASARLERGPGRDVILVSVVVTPEDAARWERRILEIVEQAGREELPQPGFQASLRRFRSALALRLAIPETTARRHAEALLLPGRAREPLAALHGVSARDLAAAARALGAPAILVYGPDLRPDR